MANINNAAKERVAMITAGAQLDQQQRMLEHQQHMSAMEASKASEQDIRQHGIAVQQQAFQAQADHQNHQLELEKQALLADQQHQNQMALQAAPMPTEPMAPAEPAAPVPPTTPPTGAI
jgi:hypothetical protein